MLSLFVLEGNPPCPLFGGRTLAVVLGAPRLAEQTARHVVLATGGGFQWSEPAKSAALSGATLACATHLVRSIMVELTAMVVGSTVRQLLHEPSTVPVAATAADGSRLATAVQSQHERACQSSDHVHGTWHNVQGACPCVQCRQMQRSPAHSCIARGPRVHQSSSCDGGAALADTHLPAPVPIISECP